jgi:tRNA threonylcarbamoyladenosine biosynthesis protein TsaE
MELISHSPPETEALGEKFGRAARSGWVIGLSGELGAGKTQLVKGLARGLGVDARVHSPTFTLVNEYAGGRLRLFHLDLFRLESRAQIQAAGLDEFLQPDGVAVIEWAEKIRTEGQRLKTESNWVSVKIEIVGESERRIVYDDPGT